MKRTLTEKHMFIAYVLNKELGYSMQAIGTLMKVSQSTISNAISRVNTMIQIRNLQAELAEARQLLAQNGITGPETNFDYKLLN